MILLGLYVRPTKPAKQLHIKAIDKLKDEYKLLKHKRKKGNKTKKLIKAPL